MPKYNDPESRDERSTHMSTPMTVSTLLFQMRSGRIDMEPAYQRDIVWNRTQRRDLIETMWMDFPIPMLFMANIVDDPQRVGTVESVDGKNRLYAIQRYVDGEFKVKSTGYDDIDNRYYNQLDEALQEEFKAKQLPVCTFTKITDDQRRDFFRRIQMGINLNSMEKLHSYDHAVVKFVSNHHRDYKASLYDRVLPETAQKRFGYQKFALNVLGMCMCDHLDTDLTIVGSDERCLNWVKKQPDAEPHDIVQRQFHTCVERIAQLINTFPSTNDVGQSARESYLPPKVHTH